MLVIRLQRTGRKGHAQFRVVVQDSRRTPTSGRVVAKIGHYDPHTKQIVINKEQAQYYLDHGAQPTDRVALLLKKEGVKLPKWVTLPAKQEGKIRNPEKLRKNQPKEETAPEQPKEDTEDATVSDSESTESEQAEA
ncbi:MAG: 30S ribosomal protein S16 [Candidatus Nomurabacteria bacterium]|nr:MAG: 30S ribosomal protein S16 [Candidatus Nomurabacteria bacterium]